VTTHNIAESSPVTPFDTLDLRLVRFNHLLNARAAREFLRQGDCRGRLCEYVDQTRAILVKTTTSPSSGLRVWHRGAVRRGMRILLL
jgi:hypothetical protein